MRKCDNLWLINQTEVIEILVSVRSHHNKNNSDGYGSGMKAVQGWGIDTAFMA